MAGDSKYNIQSGSSNENIELSVVIPVYNEEESLHELHSQLTQTLTSLKKAYELIFVDDGSTDNSFHTLLHISKSDQHVKLISFYNNYGKSSAYMAGFKACKGNIVFTLDSDLQDVPSEMPKLLNAIEQGYDLAIGWKQKRISNEPLKKIPSFFYNKIKHKIFGLKLHDSNSGFRCMRRDVAKSLSLFGDQYRFIPEYAHLRGFRVTEVATEHRARKYGKSKYGWTRFVTGIIDLISVRYLSSYSSKPLHFFGVIAFSAIILGGSLELYVLIQKFAGSSFQRHIAAIILGVLFIILGFLFLGIGLLAEMISNQKGESVYTIKYQKD